MGFFDIGDKREKVKKIRTQQHKEQLRLNREIKELERKERRKELERKKFESKTASARAEERYYEAKLARKKAKKATSRLPVFTIPAPKIRKKKQGKKLTRRSRVRLF